METKTNIDFQEWFAEAKQRLVIISKLKDEISYIRLAPIVCNDGFTISIQAGKNLSSEPRNDSTFLYSEFELGFPNMIEPLIMKFADCDDDNYLNSIYNYVPVKIINEMLEKHGGIVGS